MTLLMYKQWDDAFELLSDTLVTKADGITPEMYRSKVWPLPTLNMAMAVTGTAEVGDVWHQIINQIDGVHDIESLNEFAPDALRDIQAGLIQQHGEDVVGTSTVYHFGFPAGSDITVCYSYTTMEGGNFEPVRNEGGLRFSVKPHPQRFEAYVPDTTDEKIELAGLIRDEQDELRREGGRGAAIGGDLIAVLIENGTIRMNRWQRFPDYDESLPSFV